MKVQINERYQRYNGFFDLEEAILTHELFDGGMSAPLSRLIVKRLDAIAALVYHTEKQKYLLVTQFRAPAYYNNKNGFETEIIAGSIAEGDQPDQTLHREVEEEIGYQLASYEFICACFSSPGTVTEKVHIYYAEVNESGKIGQGGGLLEEDEYLQIKEYTFDELWQAIQTGELCDMKTVIAVQWVKINKQK